MKKKLLILLFVIAMMVCALVACGDEEETTGSSGGATNNSTVVSGGDDDCEHSFASTSKVEATCKADGKETFTCSKCGATKSETLPKTNNHNYQYTETEPTCQAAGVITGVCSVCGNTTETEGKPKTSHTGAEVIVTEATCTQEGERKWACTVCGEVQFKAGWSTVIPALGHTYERGESLFDESLGVTYVAGNCDTEGYFARVCGDCGYDEDPITREEYGKMTDNPEYDATKYDNMEIWNHDFSVFTESVPGSCEVGSYDVYKCSRCDTTQNTTTGYPLGHQYVKDETAVEDTHYVINPKPTCLYEGKRSYICTVCNAVATDDANVVAEPKLEHDITTLDKDIAATCTVAAHKVYKCALDPDCTETNTVYDGDPIPHPYELNAEGTCATNGLSKWVCPVCNAEELRNDEHAHLDAMHVYKETVSAPTCISDAVYLCSVCNSNYGPYDDDTAGKAHGNHVLVFNETIAPTCSSIGYNVYKCNVDPNCTVSGKNDDVNNLDTPKAEDVVARTEHNFDNDGNGLIDVTPDGRVVCAQCSMQYRDVTTEVTSGGGNLCLGCGNEECTCGLTVEWNGYVSPSVPESHVLAANTETTISAVEWTKVEDKGAKELAIGEGMIILDGEADTTYTIKIYDKANGELLHTFEETGDVVLVDLYEYMEVGQVSITASTVAVVYLYAIVK